MPKTKAELTVIAMKCQFNETGYTYHYPGGPTGNERFTNNLFIPAEDGDPADFTEDEQDFFDSEYMRIKMMAHYYATSRLRYFMHFGTYEWLVDDIENQRTNEVGTTPKHEELYVAFANIQKEFNDAQLESDR